VVVDTFPRTRPDECPDCGLLVRPGTDRLCPRCGYPLLFLRTQPQAEGRVVPRTPGEADDRTGLTRPFRSARPVPPVPLGDERTVRCPRCSHLNPPSRIRCEFCGLDLRARGRAVPVEPAPPERRSRKRLVAAAAVLAAAALAGAGLTALSVSRPDTGGTAAPAPAPAASTLVAVDPSTVAASASSSYPVARYAPGNTLDGDRSTAWHSDGRQGGNPSGTTLVFRFSRPVRLGRVTIVSGFAKSTTDYTNNHRMKRATVKTDSATMSWQLADTAEPQSLGLDGTSTTTVTLVVEEVYRGTRFNDVCVSEATFSEYRPAQR
jgi:hypothetical protein